MKLHLKYKAGQGNQVWYGDDLLWSEDGICATLFNTVKLRGGKEKPATLFLNGTFWVEEFPQPFSAEVELE